MTVQHSYFQTLSTDGFDGDIDVCWEQELSAGSGIRVALWAGSDNLTDRKSVVRERV